MPLYDAISIEKIIIFHKFEKKGSASVFYLASTEVTEKELYECYFIHIQRTF